MYKLAQWLYELGAKNEQRKLHMELLFHIGQQPVRYLDSEAGIEESEQHYNKRLDAWFAAREMIQSFFEPQRDNDVL